MGISRASIEKQSKVERDKYEKKALDALLKNRTAKFSPDNIDNIYRMVELEASKQ